MVTLREAAQQALEAMEDAMYRADTHEFYDAKESLRTALAEPVQPVADRDTVIRLAREVGLWEMLEGYSSEYGSLNTEDDCLGELQRFAALVAAAAVRETSAEYRLGWNDGQMMEREECAKVCDERATADGWEGCYADQCAAAIRSRK